MMVRSQRVGAGIIVKLGLLKQDPVKGPVKSYKLLYRPEMSNLRSLGVHYLFLLLLSFFGENNSFLWFEKVYQRSGTR